MSGLLWRKAVRDLTRSAHQFAAAALIVTLGVGFYLGLLSAYKNMSASYQAYYERCHFADFEVQFDLGTARLADRVARMPGVTGVNGRLVQDLLLERPGRKDRRITCRVISLPDGTVDRVDDVLIVQGRRPVKGAREILLEKRFAEYHGYRVGDRVRLLIAGEDVDYRLVGLAVSPEYIYPIPSKEYLLPSPSTFGVAFALKPEVEDMLGDWGLINDLVVTCDPARRAGIMADVKRMLEPYGVKKPEPREDQPSYYVLGQDLAGYRPMATLFPGFLLAAAALALYTLLRRMVESQRPVIGFLRASGFTRLQIVAHYASVPLLIGLITGALGIAVGQALALGTTRIYLDTLNIPLLAAPMHWDLAAVGMLLGIAACMVGGAGPALRAAGLRPADALRDAPTPAGSRPILERLLPVAARVSVLAKLPLRNLARRPGRAFWAAAGIAAGCMLIIISGSWRDAVDDMMATYFQLMHRYDLSVAFSEPQTEHQAFRVSKMPGVWRAEGVLSVPVEALRGNRSLTTVLVGLEPDSRLLDLRGTDRDRLPLLPGEVLASKGLRSKLGVATGDVVTLRYAFESKDRRGEMRAVVGPQMLLPVGQSLYMNIADVRRYFGSALDLPPAGISSVMVRTMPSGTAWVQGRLYDLPLAGAVSSMAQTRRDLDEQMAFMNAFIAVLVFFGAALALGVVYAIVSVSVMERRRELASLRAEGVSRRAITVLVSAENLAVWAVGCLVGLPLGTHFALAMLGTYTTDIMELAPVIYPRTIVMAAVVTLAAVLVSQWPAIRYIQRLNMAEVLRYRE